MKFFDLHCDTLYKCNEENLKLNDTTLSVDFGCKYFDKYVQAFAAFIPDDEQKGFIKLCQMRNRLNEGNIEPVICAKDLEDSKCAIFTVENGRALDGNIDNIQKLYNLGVRVITLTWNGKNEIASGCNEQGGLSNFGIDVINIMNSKKMAVDLSHINRQGFFEAAEIAQNILCTHSCFAGVVPHKRNLSDEQALTVASNGGIIGICFYPAFVGQGNAFYCIAKQIEYGLKLGIQKHLAIGTDFDGAKMDDKLERTAQIPTLYNYLCNYFKSTQLIDDIFYNNAVAYFKKLFDK